jgi:hypothetical protein
VVRRIGRHKRALVASLAAVAALGMTASSTLGGFSAGISNGTSTFSSATIQLEESNGTTTCYSTGSGGTGGSVTATNTNTTCTINGLVGTLDQVPGGTALTTTLTFTNAGNHAVTVASLVMGACTQATASDANAYVGSDTSFCNKVDVTIANTTTGAADKCVYPTQTALCPALANTDNLSTLAGTTFTAAGPGPLSVLAPAASATYVVTVQLDSGVANNADQGLTATVPFTWSISQ